MMITTASSPAKVTSLLLVFLNAALVVRLPGVAAGTTDLASSSSSSYRPTAGVEDRWTTEDEFRGGNVGQEQLVEQSWWDDDDDDDDDDRLLPAASPSSSATARAGEGAAGPRRPRWRAWKHAKAGKRGTARPPSAAAADDDPHAAGAAPAAAASEYDEEHPMRTDEWRVDVRLSRLCPKEEGGYFPEYDGERLELAGPGEADPPPRRSSYRKRQVMQFARNGYVKVLEERSDVAAATEGKTPKKPVVGKWRMGHSGVAFDIPVQVHVKRKRGTIHDNDDGDSQRPSSRTTVLHYHADLHMNKFGERPRMFRGVITRDRCSALLPPRFLRPVVGTFSAEGIGRDTADTRYRDRATSLSRQQARDEARREGR